MAPSDDQTPDKPKSSDKAKSNDVKSTHGHINILPLPKTRMNRFQDAQQFEEGDYTPIALDELKRRRRARLSGERIRSRQKMVIQKRRLQKRRRVLLKRLKYIANLGAFFIMAITVWVLIVNPLWRFNGENFTLRHNHLLSASHVRPIIKDYQKLPIYQVDPQAITDSIKAHFPIVDSVYVRRSVFPPRLDINVIEKTPIAEIYTAPEALAPISLAAFSGSDRRYGAVPIALYAYRPGRYKTAQGQPLIRLIVPPGVQLTQHEWQRLDHLMQQSGSIQKLPLKAIELVNLPLERNSKKGKSLQEYSVILHYPELMIFAGVLDAEINQRVARLPLIGEKILAFRSAIRAVDLRWSEQITFVKTGAPLPLLASPPPQESAMPKATPSSLLKVKPATEPSAAASKPSRN
ncbi:MAG: FtsQ-type POTRA domain-containing protein [Vampirovibrionales bacterium]|nr:FtsQ-type POTRA domain-containing protein [Vampirovibrionales bacterium]